MHPQFDHNRITNHIEQYGVDTTYIPARLCSCVGRDGYPKAGCDCINGYRFDEDAKSDVRILRTGVDLRKMMTEMVNVFQGAATLTIPRYTFDENGGLKDVDAWGKVAVRDIFIVKNRHHRASDILIKGVRDKIRTYSLALDERQNPQIVSIMQEGTKYPPDSYVVNKDGDVQWVGTPAPDTNGFYAVEFIENPHYVIWLNMGMDRGYEDMELPRRFIAKLRTYVPDSLPTPSISKGQVNPLL